MLTVNKAFVNSTSTYRTTNGSAAADIIVVVLLLLKLILVLIHLTLPIQLISFVFLQVVGMLAANVFLNVATL